MVREVGRDNMFICGMAVDQVETLRAQGYSSVRHTLSSPERTGIFSYDAATYIERNAELAQCIDQIENGEFNPERPDLYRDIGDILRHHDRYDACPQYSSLLIEASNLKASSDQLSNV